MRELILTGLPEFWPDDEANSLFLGPWCFAGHHKYQFWEHVNFSIVPPPWRSPEDSLRPARYVDSLCDRILPAFGDLMNHFHQVNHSEHFWKVVSIAWLVHWLGMCFDRYQRLRHIEQVYRGLNPLNVTILAKDVVRLDSWRTFVLNRCAHAYNLQLLSDIIRESDEFGYLRPSVSRIALSATASHHCTVDHQRKSYSFTERARRCAGGALGAAESFLLSRVDARCFLGTVYGMTRRDKLLIQMALDPLTHVRRRPRRGDQAPQAGDRSLLLKLPLAFAARSDFEEVVRTILPAHLPASYLTYWPEWPAARSVTKVWVGHDIHGDIRSVYRIAHVIEQGGRLVSAQHGCAYGHSYPYAIGKIEYETATAFLTWGWSHPHIYPGVFVPQPSPMLSKLKRHRGGTAQLLFVGTALAPYHYRFHQGIFPESALRYLQAKRLFLARLRKDVLASLCYRPYVHDYGVDETAWIAQACPSCDFLTGGTLTTLLRRAGLLVCDHPGTTMLEACAMNAPMILFWSPTDWPMLPAARPLFDELRSVGILLHSPEDAAEKVNEVWPDVRSWWQRKDVQKVRERFQSQYARTSKHWRREWIVFLKEQLRAYKDSESTQSCRMQPDRASP